MPRTDHVHGVLALRQRGQLRLRVVQGHSLPQGPQVTWVALLSTKSTNTKSTTTKEKKAEAQGGRGRSRGKGGIKGSICR